MTHNNPVVSPQDYLEGWFTTQSDIVYVNGQLEGGEQADTPHIQAYIHFSKPKTLTSLKKRDPRAHFAPVKIDNGASSYCMKEETRLDGPW